MVPEITIPEGQVFVKEDFRNFADCDVWMWGPVVAADESKKLTDAEDKIRLIDIGTGESRELTHKQIFGRAGYDPVKDPPSWKKVMFSCEDCGHQVVTNQDIFAIVKQHGVGAAKDEVIAKVIVERVCETLADVFRIYSLVKAAKDIDYKLVAEHMSGGELVGVDSPEPKIKCTNCPFEHNISPETRTLLSF